MLADAGGAANLIIETLEGHAPVYQDFYGGDSLPYIVFNFVDENPEAFGDNRPHRTVVDVQIHWYLSRFDVYQAEARTICTELKAAGFTWPSATVMLEDDTDLRHVTFETSIKTLITWED